MRPWGDRGPSLQLACHGPCRTCPSLPARRSCHSAAPAPPRPGPHPCRRGFTHVLAASTSYGRNVLPRAAALLDVQVRAAASGEHGAV